LYDDEYPVYETHKDVVQDVIFVRQSGHEEQDNIPHGISGRALTSTQPLEEHRESEIAKPR
jgi:hypothetical protein